MKRCNFTHFLYVLESYMHRTNALRKVPERRPTAVVSFNAAAVPLFIAENVAPVRSSLQGVKGRGKGKEISLHRKSNKQQRQFGPQRRQKTAYIAVAPRGPSTGAQHSFTRDDDHVVASAVSVKKKGRGRMTPRSPVHHTLESTALLLQSHVLGVGPPPFVCCPTGPPSIAGRGRPFTR